MVSLLLARVALSALSRKKWKKNPHFKPPEGGGGGMEAKRKDAKALEKNFQGSILTPGIQNGPWNHKTKIISLILRPRHVK